MISMDMRFLDADKLEKLRKLEPQPAELATLKAYKGDISELAEVGFCRFSSSHGDSKLCLRCARFYVGASFVLSRNLTRASFLPIHTHARMSARFVGSSFEEVR